MSDAERLAETRKVLDDLDRLNSQVSYIDVQAKAIKYNSEMLNTYFWAIWASIFSQTYPTCRLRSRLK